MLKVILFFAATLITLVMTLISALCAGILIEDERYPEYTLISLYVFFASLYGFMLSFNKAMILLDARKHVEEDEEV